VRAHVRSARVAADGLWAIGDVTGKGLLTKVAVHQGRVAVEHILGADPEPVSYRNSPVSCSPTPRWGPSERRSRPRGRPATTCSSSRRTCARRCVPVLELARLAYALPTFYGAVGEAVGAYGRGIVRVLDPGTAPVVDDPPWPKP
jgi:hypothetical protein